MVPSPVSTETMTTSLTMGYRMLFLVAVTTVLVMPVADGIRCFQCATTNPNDECVKDYSGFVNDSLGKTAKYIKDCTAAKDSWDRCMIETTEQDGKLRVFNRGCHDGINFANKFNSNRFANITPTNRTTCEFVTILVCYTFCDTDLCNGPQPPENKTCNNETESCGVLGFHTAGYSTQVGLCAYIMLVMCVLLLQY